MFSFSGLRKDRFNTEGDLLEALQSQLSQTPTEERVNSRIPPSFETLLKVPLLLLVKHVKNRDESLLFYKVGKLGSELDILISYLIPEIQQGEVLEKSWISFSHNSDPLLNSLPPVLEQAYFIHQMNKKKIIKRISDLLGAIYYYKMSLEHYMNMNTRLSFELAAIEPCLKLANEKLLVSKLEEEMVKRLSSLLLSSTPYRTDYTNWEAIIQFLQKERTSSNSNNNKDSSYTKDNSKAKSGSGGSAGGGGGSGKVPTHSNREKEETQEEFQIREENIDQENSQEGLVRKNLTEKDTEKKSDNDHGENKEVEGNKKRDNKNVPLYPPSDLLKDVHLQNHTTRKRKFNRKLEDQEISDGSSGNLYPKPEKLNSSLRISKIPGSPIFGSSSETSTPPPATSVSISSGSPTVSTASPPVGVVGQSSPPLSLSQTYSKNKKKYTSQDNITLKNTVDSGIKLDEDWSKFPQNFQDVKGTMEVWGNRIWDMGDSLNSQEVSQNFKGTQASNILSDVQD